MCNSKKLSVVHRCVQSNIVLLTQAFRKKFVIPDFESFTSHIDQLYESAKDLSEGQVGRSRVTSLVSVTLCALMIINTVIL